MSASEYSRLYDIFDSQVEATIQSMSQDQSFPSQGNHTAISSKLVVGRPRTSKHIREENRVKDEKLATKRYKLLPSFPLSMCLVCSVPITMNLTSLKKS